MTLRRAAAAVALAACAAGSGACQGQPAPAAGDGWRSFSGRWSATGERHSLPTGGERPASVLRLSGTITIEAGGLGRGFLGEAVGFDDGREASHGRAVWTDDQGDRIFSTLTGGPVSTSRRVTGTITGGTGRYAGVSGDYQFTWQFVTDAGDGVVQGRTTDLAGRVRGGRP